MSLTVSKCANPTCSKPFHFLHEGKLFRLMSGYRSQHRQAAEHHVEYLWLCAECALKYSLSFDLEKGVVLTPIEAASAAEGAKLVFVVGDQPPDHVQSHDEKKAMPA